MKKLFLSLFLLAFVMPVKAIDESVEIATSTYTSVEAGRLKLLSLEVINNAAAALTVRIYDAPTTNINYVVAAYDTVTSYTTNLVTTTTNLYNVVSSHTNQVLYSVETTVAASTNTFPLKKTFIVAAGAASTWTPQNGVYFVNGLTVFNGDTNTIVNVTYEK